MHKLKNLKAIFKRYKLLIVITLIFIVAIPLFVLATNDPETGYRAVKNVVSPPMFYVAEDGLGVEPIGFCVNNTSSNDYFVPTAKFADVVSFVNNKPSGVYLAYCVGDGQCTGSENCSNAPSDCGPCAIPTPDPCATSCTASCPCSDSCTINCGSAGGTGNNPPDSNCDGSQFWGSC